MASLIIKFSVAIAEGITRSHSEHGS
jgi:hypothetical protein